MVRARPDFGEVGETTLTEEEERLREDIEDDSSATGSTQFSYALDDEERRRISSIEEVEAGTSSVGGDGEYIGDPGGTTGPTREASPYNTPDDPSTDVEASPYNTPDTSAAYDPYVPQSQQRNVAIPELEGFAAGVGNTLGAVKGAGEGTFNLATGRESGPSVIAGAGRSLTNAFTGGNAEQFREDFWEQEGNRLEEQAAFQEEVEGDFLSRLGAVNTAGRVGIDILADTPNVPNLQDAGGGLAQAVTLSSSKEEAARKIGGIEDAVNDFNQGLGSGYQNLIEGTPVEDNLVLGNLDAIGGTGFEWLIADPFLEAPVTVTTGIDPDTNSPEGRADPIDVFEGATLGAGKLLSTGAKAGKGAGLLGGLFGRADEAARAGSKADEAADASKVDDTIGNRETLDEFDTTRGTQRAAAGAGKSADETGDIADEGIPVVWRGGDDTNIDDAMSAAKASDEDIAQAAKATDVAEETPGPVPGIFGEGNAPRELFGGGLSRLGRRLFRGGDDAAGASDEAGGFFQRARQTVTRGGDDAAKGDDITDATRARRATDEDVARTVPGAADEAATGLSRLTRPFTRLWGRLGRTGKILTVGGAGAVTAGQFLGPEDFGSGGDSDPDSGGGGGGQDGERYRRKAVRQYPDIGTLMEVQKGNGETGWMTAGYAVWLGAVPEGRMADLLGMPAGTVAVVSQQARPTAVSPVTGSGRKAVPSPRFGSQGAADDAHQAFKQWLEQQADDDGSQKQGGPQKATSFDGSLRVPDAVNLGEAFTAEWSATLAGTQQSWSSRLVLGLETEDGIVPLDEDSMTLDNSGGGGPLNQSVSDSGTFEVPSGWTAVEPQEYPIHAIIMKDGESVGSLAKENIDVKEGDEGDKSEEDSKWDDPELVRELNYGWYLYAEVKKDDSGETRFMVVGVREDGTRIYLDGDGRGQTDPKFFPTAEKAVAAYETWVKRHKNGQTGDNETPSEEADRPSAGGIKRDAAGVDESAAGLVGRLSQAARRNPILATAVSAVVIGGGYYLYQEGFFTDALTQVEEVFTT